MASMDRGLEERLMKLLLNEFAGQVTVLLVTHKMQHIRQADRVIILEQGKLAIDGPANEVLAQMQRGSEASK